MRLIFCIKCNDFFRITVVKKVCSCEQSSGIAIDKSRAIYHGKYAIPIVIDIKSFFSAIKNSFKTTIGFQSFVVFNKDIMFYRADTADELDDQMNVETNKINFMDKIDSLPMVTETAKTEKPKTSSNSSFNHVNNAMNMKRKTTVKELLDDLNDYGDLG